MSKNYLMSVCFLWVFGFEYSIQFFQCVIFGFNEEKVDEGIFEQVLEYKEDVVLEGVSMWFGCICEWWV